MRKLLLITLALVLASVSAVAQAGDRYYRHHNHHHRDAYVAGGLLLGMIAGAALADRDDHYVRRDYRYDDGYYGGSYYRDGYYGYTRPYRRDVVIYRDVPRYYGPTRYYGYDRGYRHYGPRHYRHRHHHHHHHGRHW
jgi:hypothetical protein